MKNQPNFKQKYSYQDCVTVRPNFPIKGIMFSDFNRMLCNPEKFCWAIDELAAFLKKHNFTTIICPESRGFYLGSPLAYLLKKKLVVVRKPGKLAGDLYRQSFDYEYASTTIEMQRSALSNGERVAIIDDVMADGGTVNAIEKICSNFSQVSIVCYAFLLVKKNGKRYQHYSSKNLFSIFEE